MALNRRQKKFADIYLKIWNATEAAKRAGYSEKTAASIGYENLRKPEIAEYIRARASAQDTQIVADANEVMAFLTSVMRGEVKDQFGLDASLADRLKAGADLMKRYPADKQQLNTDGIQSLAELLRNPQPNRNIAEFEAIADE